MDVGPQILHIRYAHAPTSRARALRDAFRRVRRQVWTHRERDLRWHLELGANWTIA